MADKLKMELNVETVDLYLRALSELPVKVAYQAFTELAAYRMTPRSVPQPAAPPEQN
jgi:hypothetical protein